ncbi:MAG TPA: hypothetical protein VH084_29950 [Mycobacterium sp.]|jgi:hypothetical protein|nr:hypothetical protein [Mycobacterium sp.]
MAIAPRNCTHGSTHEVPIMDGKGNVVARHIVCNDCNMIIGTK